MSTIQKEDSLTQAGERAFQNNYEKFKQDTQEYLRKLREAKARKNKEAEKPVESTDSDN
jgi:uncharacterized protein YukE